MLVEIYLEQAKNKDCRAWVVRRIGVREIREGYCQTPTNTSFLLIVTVSMKAS
jgi:hypothetical protein